MLSKLQLPDAVERKIPIQCLTQLLSFRQKIILRPNRFGAIFSLFLIFCSTKTKTFVVPSNLCRNLANTPEQRLIDLSKD